jgi:hypothetical protein
MLIHNYERPQIIVAPASSPPRQTGQGDKENEQTAQNESRQMILIEKNREMLLDKFPDSRIIRSFRSQAGWWRTL